MTLNGVMTVILRFSPNSVTMGADYVNVVDSKIDLYSLRQKHNPKNLVFSNISMAIFAEVTEN